MTIYQTKTDEDREWAALDRWQTARGTKVGHVRRVLAPFDGVELSGSDLNAILEVKVRNNPRLKYPTYMIDKAKVDKLHDMAGDLGVVGVVLVQFTNTLCYATTHRFKKSATVSAGGRTDRGDKNDIDTVYLLPIQYLTEVD